MQMLNDVIQNDCIEKIIRQNIKIQRTQVNLKKFIYVIQSYRPTEAKSMSNP